MRNLVYFFLKPILPWKLRMGIRRWHAGRLKRSAGDTWPIQPSAGKTPVGWSGWRDGREFAVVLTHDVEGPEGLARVRQLAELEMSLGFRSSFNFVPEGKYVVPDELREWLLGNGFEVGVHDLHHDGSLYRSRSVFQRQAKKINHYLKAWGVRGFRSGFMLNNLDWLHDLEIDYDASTFDNDPFEPQPVGAGTIFPFWVAPRTSGGAQDLPGNRRGYVELPYTLPQDSTLFLLLRESSPELWLRKLAWIASHGGMALVNVHPDYICFPGEEPDARTYPVERYRSLLNAVHNYGSVVWRALPSDLARWYGSLRLDERTSQSPTLQTSTPNSTRKPRGVF